MSGIQYILLLFIVLVLVRHILRYRKNLIDGRLFVWWLLFWLLAMAAVLRPEILNRLADLLGVGRGADVALYLAVFLIFFIIFKLYGKIIVLEKNITKIVQTLALRDKDGTQDEN